MKHVVAATLTNATVSFNIKDFLVETVPDFQFLVKTFPDFQLLVEKGRVFNYFPKIRRSRVHSQLLKYFVKWGDQG